MKTPLYLALIGILSATAGCAKAPHGRIVEVTSANPERLWSISPHLDTNSAIAAVEFIPEPSGPRVEEAAGAQTPH
jgi:hypothetical protein